MNFVVDTLTNRYESVAPLVGWWKLDETTGTEAADATGNGHTGELHYFTGTYWVDGKTGYGKALYFDGSEEEDYVSVTDDAAFDTGSELTVSHWFKTGTAQSNKPMVLHDNSSYVYGTWQMTNSTYIYFAVLQPSGYAYVPAYNASGWDDDEWHHVVGIFDRNPSSGNRLKLYIDGTLYTHVSNAYDEDIVGGDDGIQLARWSANYFDGTIDNVQVFDRALTALQVEALYRAESSIVIDYDAAGNLVRDHRGYKYSYDYENRVTRIQKHNGSGGFDDVAEMDYDALGRRICKVDSVSSETTYYYYNDKWQVLAADYSGSYDHRYVYGNYIDEVLIMDADSNYYYYAHNHLFSTVALTDDTGGVVERYEYNAYGKVQIMTSAFVDRDFSLFFNPYTFTGRRLDTLDGGDLKIMYYRNRYYDTETGRFLQHDPLETQILEALSNHIPLRRMIYENFVGNLLEVSLLSSMQRQMELAVSAYSSSEYDVSKRILLSILVRRSARLRITAVPTQNIFPLIRKFEGLSFFSYIDVNRYQYANSNPALFVDPYGLLGCVECEEACDSNFTQNTALIACRACCFAELGIDNVSQECLDKAITKCLIVGASVPQVGIEQHIFKVLFASLLVVVLLRRKNGYT